MLVQKFKTALDASKNWIINHTIYLRFLKNRMSDDKIDVLASSLSFTTIGSLVPLLAVLLSIFSMFPSFVELKEKLMSYIMQHLMPQMGDVVNEHINTFVSQASNTTIVGLLVLLGISLLLLRRVDITLNNIWHASIKERSAITTFSMYWMVLTLGPIILGISLMITSYITTRMFIEGTGVLGNLSTFLVSLIPMFLSWVIFTLVFLAVPNTKVKFVHALGGAFLAALAQELIKRGFTFYIVNFSSYATVYGAVAAVPILMLWVYVNWYVILVGAEIAASIKAYGEITQSTDKAAAVAAAKDAEKEVRAKAENLIKEEESEAEKQLEL